MGKDSNDEQVASMKEAFFLFGMDDDGKIAILELGILMRSLSRNPAQAQLKDNITLENLRSTFDFPRFLELMKKHLKNKPSNCQLCDAFKVFDKESISFISVSHLGRIVTAIM